MTWWKYTRRDAPSPLEYNIRTLDEILTDRDPVELTEHALIVVEAPTRTQSQAAPVRLEETVLRGAEIGTARSQFASFMREEYNPKLRGKQGLKTYDEMRRSDGAVQAALQAVKSPITGASWFVSPAEDTAEAKKHADFVTWNLTKGMTYPWMMVLQEALLQFDFGYYMFEKVWAIKRVDGELRMCYQKLAPRHPMDVVEGGWRFDANGGPKGVWMYDAEGGMDSVFIPVEKLAIFTHQLEAGELTGRSMLRPAYKHWFIKENIYKIDAIQKERHGIGIPVIKLPHGFTVEDKNKAHEIGRNLRSNEKAHVVLPPNWDLVFAKLEGQPVSALETAEHHARMIYQSVLAQALWASNSADGEASMDMFYKALRHLAENIAVVVNTWIIPQLIQANWDTDKFPELRVRKLGDTAEARTLSFAVRNFIGAGVIVPDDRLEEWARDVIDAPKADKATAREIATPQLGKSAKAGLPRQSQAKNQHIGPQARGAGDQGGN